VNDLVDGWVLLDQATFGESEMDREQGDDDEGGEQAP
jgi:hypothetical protein